jgi:hypothetical protein
MIFILFATGIPEPSDKECQEGSHSLCVREVYLLQMYKENDYLIIKKNDYEKSIFIMSIGIIADIS